MTKLRNKYQKGEAKEFVARLLRAGHTQAEVGRLMESRFGFTLSTTSICKLAAELEEDYEKASVSTRLGHKEEQVLGLMDIYREASEAWERSKENTRKTVKEIPPERPCMKCKGTGKLPPELSGNHNKKNNAMMKACDWCKGKGSFKPTGDITITVAGRLPDNAYLRTMMDCRLRILEIYGLIDRRNIDNSTNTINMGDKTVEEFWARLMGGAPPQEARLAAIEMGQLPDTSSQPQKVETPNEST